MSATSGDGVHPECTSCLRSNRSCQWPTDSSDAASNQTNRANNDAASQLRPIPELISTSDPELALRDPRVFYLFRHYKDNLASWYDLNDHHRHFTDIVPVKARYSPLLLSAILAFSAISLLSSSISGPWADQANFYLLESVEILLEVTRNIEAAVSDGEVLAAICLLRSYEIISENLGSQSHLRGYYSILASTSINLDSLSSLARASFWNFLRENITVALIERQKLMVELPDELVPKDLDSDDDYANAITILLGQVINQCFGEDTSSVDRLLYLENRLEVWKASIPHSFTPIVNHDSVGHYQRPFPFMGTLHGWHAASIQYYQTAMIILALARPKFQTNKTTDNMRYVTELTRNLENRSSEICALALSSESQAVWVNSFGPIAFCGSWLRDVRKLRVTIRGVEHWGSRTGWPTSKIIKCLRETSADDGSH
ncbi:uncharacterized protein N7469_008849 [Penicillium citrinum]|uniref:Uncharacterized protein n=1 Tax=Penicillium citrinum TaxID=5077 RepID=A0A9W9NQ06_PENCI|nr:uncharacterized protein N7469_008849 [Penicillium citrinum]KAJ5222609.1 hypothetical protein N7469_008849 [Penicillium citrinum]